MNRKHPAYLPQSNQDGFILLEFLISTLLLVLVSASIFQVMASTQQSAVYQNQVQTALQNSRTALEFVERCIRQAGNNPRKAVFQAVEIASATEVRLRSDLTGAAAGNPNMGDPDGDVLDAGEDVTVRYISAGRRLELVPAGQAAQTIADNITGFSLLYFDAAGNATVVGANVRKVRITVTASTNVPDPKTGKPFSIRTATDVQIVPRI